jgi:hypothetical protein
MYNRLIFINFISRSKKVKPKSKSCRKYLFTANKLLRLWHFVSVLNLKFLDQLERRHSKDTPFFRPFYIRAPKGPFLWGLNLFSLLYHQIVRYIILFPYWRRVIQAFRFQDGPFLKCYHINFASQSGNGNKFSTRKLHAQKENTPRSPLPNISHRVHCTLTVYVPSLELGLSQPLSRQRVHC